ncbi:MAG TPA: NUDIX hydrolase [Anaerolineales bacterium]
MEKILEYISEIVKQIPKIIQQAAKSLMGMMAMVILVLSILGAVLFYDASETIRLVVFGAMFAGGVLFVFALIFQPRFASKESNSPTQAAAICYRVTKNNKIEFLLIQSSGKRWIFPKGRIEENENIWDTAQREAFEEAGVSGEIDKKRLTTFLHHKRDLKTRGIEVVIAAYLLKVVSTQKAKEKGRKPTWYSYEDALNAFAKDRSSKYFNEYKKVLGLAQDRINESIQS